MAIIYNNQFIFHTATTETGQFHVCTESLVELDASAQSMAESVSAVFLGAAGLSNFRGLFKTTVGIDSLKTSKYDDGVLVDVAEVACSAQGSSTDGTLPNQLSVVVSFAAAGAGRDKRGRIYLPPYVNTATTTNGTLGSTQQEYTANMFQNFLDDLAEEGIPAGIANGKKGSTLAFTTLHNIASLRVGNVLDTQRRRRNGVAETYLTRSITPPA